MNEILLNGLQYEVQGAGISKYTQKLIDTYIREEYPVDVLVRKEVKVDNENEQVLRVASTITSSTKRIIEEQIKQRNTYKKYQLVHFPDYATPLLYRGIKVATIHDMAMHTMRDKYTLIQNLTKNTLLNYTVRAAEHLICDSHFAKKELLHYYPNIKADISVVYLGVESPKVIGEQALYEDVIRKYKICKPYLLAVGTLAPHKNIVSMIKAFATVKGQGEDYQLVIAGKKGWMYDEIFKEVEALGLKGEIIFTDYISEDELEVLYKKADLYISTSLYEGFGFPPLEAMLRECPALVSDIEVFREVAGEGAWYCDQNSSEDIAKQILYLLHHKEVCEWLVEQGKENVQRFSWQRAAKETFNIYEQILKETK